MKQSSLIRPVLTVTKPGHLLRIYEMNLRKFYGLLINDGSWPELAHMYWEYSTIHVRTTCITGMHQKNGTFNEENTKEEMMQKST